MTAKKTPSKKQAAKKATAPKKPAQVVEDCKDGLVTVVIDPGHGDIISKSGQPDSGAVATEGKVTYMEKDLALDVSKAIRDALKGKPKIRDVFLTREADKTEAVTRFKWRTDFARDKNAQIFLCVHLNSSGPTATGHIVFYYPGPIVGESAKLAKAIDAKFKTIAAFSSGGYKSESHHMGLVKFGGDHPVKAAVLIETGFITNTADRTALSTQATQIGAEIAEGTLDYIKDNHNMLCSGWFQLEEQKKQGGAAAAPPP